MQCNRKQISARHCCSLEWCFVHLFVLPLQFSAKCNIKKYNFFTYVSATFYDFIMCFTVALSSLLHTGEWDAHLYTLSHRVYVGSRQLFFPLFVYITWCSVVCNFYCCFVRTIFFSQGGMKLPVRDHRLYTLGCVSAFQSLSHTHTFTTQQLPLPLPLPLLLLLFWLRRTQHNRPIRTQTLSNGKQKSIECVVRFAHSVRQSQVVAEAAYQFSSILHFIAWTS